MTDPAASPNTNASHDRAVAAGIALLLAAIYVATGAYHFTVVDEIASFALTRSLVSHGGADVDILAWVAPLMSVFSVTAPGLDGHTYALKDVGPSILMVPLAGLGYLLRVSPVRLAYLFPIGVTALTGGLLYHVARSRGYARRTAILASLTYGLASLAFPYAKTLFTQPVAALGLLAALQAALSARAKPRPAAAFLSGLGLSLAALSALPLWVAAPVYLALLVVRRDATGSLRLADPKETARLLAAWAAAALPLGLVQAIYNWSRFGSILATGHEQIGANLALSYAGLGSWGLLISAPRGLVWFSPFAVLVPFGLWLAWKRRDFDLQAACLTLFGIVLIVYSAYFNWSGGMAFGPRFLAPVAPQLVLMAAPLLDSFLDRMKLWRRLLVGAVLAVSALTALGGSLFDVLRAESHIYDVLDKLTPPPGFFAYSPEMLDPANLVQAHLLKAAQRGWWDVLWMSRGSPDWLMLAVDGALIGLSVLSLAWIARAARARAALMLACQAALLLGVVGWSIGRYPRASGYSRAETPPAPELDQTLIHLHDQAMLGDGAVVALLQDDNLAWLEAPLVGPPDIGLPLEAPLRPSSLALLEKTPGWYSRLWVVSRGALPGDPHNGVEAWLSGRAYVGQASQIGDFRIVPYAFAANGLALRDVGRSFGGQGLRLTAYASQLGGPGGRSWLNVWLRWEASQAPSQNYTVFVHLLDPGGRLAAQHDGQPQASYAPMLTWPVGAPVDDRHCLLIPGDLPPGDYALMVGLYDPASGQRLPVDGGNADALTLQLVNIPPIDR